jgi:hypothetical protein
MGQTDEYSWIDENGDHWYEVYLCPVCWTELATRHLVDEQMMLDPDDIIGCDKCNADVSVERAIIGCVNQRGEYA